MSIKITTDSTCDLPGALLRRHGISVIPLGIVKDGVLFRDGESITPEAIAAHVDAGGEITTTSAVNPVDYHAFFQPLAQEYDAVIHINLGAGFSSCHQNARLAAAGFENVYPADSANLSTGQGLVVLAAAEAAERGGSVEEILSLVEQAAQRVEASFVLDTLEYMKKGGRCSSVLALGANLLKLHPCIEVSGGKMSVVKKYRGSMEKTLQEYVRERLEGREDVDRRVILVNACRTPGLVEGARAALERYGNFTEIVEARAGCSIFCHCGPDTLGIMFCRK